MIYGFTGHRPARLGGYAREAQQKVYDLAYQMIEHHFNPGDEAIIGMAQGWDMAVASACVVLTVPFTAAVPYPGQELVWPNEETRGHYQTLLRDAKQVVYVSQSTGGNAPRALQLRNQWIVDHSQKLIALWDEVESGGTWNCVKYARNRGVEVINVWKDWEALNA